MIRILTKIKKLYYNWNWILMILFLMLSIIEFRFGVLAILCILPAFGMAIRSRNRKFCAVSCPRGNFLQQFLSNWNKNFRPPSIFRNKIFKNIVFVLMFTLFIRELLATNGSIAQVGYVFFRFILSSTLIGLILGLIFRPRTWCQICPLGQGTQITGKLSMELKNLYDR